MAMVGMSAADLLTAWDNVPALRSGQPHWTQRNAELLRAFGVAGRGATPDGVGSTQAELLRVYAENFGDRLDGVARCPQCATEIELTLALAELTARVPAAQAVEPLTAGGHTVHWRLPSGVDVADAAACADPAQGALMLLSRCVVGTDSSPVDLPARLRGQLAERIAAADPYADIDCTLVCPECAQPWDAWLDVGEFVFAGLRAAAHRLLGEVDELARAYGWSEAEILRLPQARRDAYLELVRHG